MFLIKYNFIPFPIRINQNLAMASHTPAYNALSCSHVCQRRCQVLRNYAGPGGCEWPLAPICSNTPLLSWPSEGGSQGLETLHVPWLSPEQQQAYPQPLLRWTSAHISIHYSILSNWIVTLYSLFDRRKCLCQWNFNVVSELTQINRRWYQMIIIYSTA